MSEITDFETYLSISPKKFGIYLFDINQKRNLYKEEITFKTESQITELISLTKFLEDNIFKIEKLVGKFIKNICLIIENNKIINIDMGIKKKNYKDIINKKNLENTIIDAKDLFKENYQDKKILHMIINKYIVNGHKYDYIEENLIADNYCIEVKFKSIEKKYLLQISKVLEKYQIEAIKYLDGEYIKNFCENDKSEISEIAHKVQNGLNENEVIIIPKNPKKLGFFEKFFQLFS